MSSRDEDMLDRDKIDEVLERESDVADEKNVGVGSGLLSLRKELLVSSNTSIELEVN